VGFATSKPRGGTARHRDQTVRSQKAKLNKEQKLARLKKSQNLTGKGSLGTGTLTGKRGVGARAKPVELS